MFLVVGSLVRHRADVGVLNLDVQTLLVGQVKELVVDVVCVIHVFLEAEDCEFFEIFRFVDHRVEAL